MSAGKATDEFAVIALISAVVPLLSAAVFLAKVTRFE
jgi:hypothetical protein